MGPNRLPSSCDTTRQCHHSASSPSSYLPRIHELGLSIQESEQSCHCWRNLKSNKQWKKMAFSHIDANNNTHSIHLIDHNPGRSKTWLLSGHRVNKVNGLCPMCPTSMCQPQNKLAHHLCQSHRWCPHSNRGKPLGHPYSLICGIFWHTTPRHWPNMLWDECNEMNVNEMYI